MTTRNYFHELLTARPGWIYGNRPGFLERPGRPLNREMKRCPTNMRLTKTNHGKKWPETAGGESPADLRVDGVKFRRVLVAVDFRNCTFEMLRHARALAKKFEAAVEVLHVIDFTPKRDAAATPCSGLIRAMGDAARQELKKLVGILWESGTEATVAVREGRTDEVIINEAGAINAELIIMGTSKHRWPATWLRRNTVKRVLQNSPCPVMVLRAGMMKAGATRQDAPSFATRCNFRWPAGK
jgi:nucleotide-binding universal stress UspA family protein